MDSEDDPAHTDEEKEDQGSDIEEPCGHGRCDRTEELGCRERESGGESGVSARKAPSLGLGQRRHDRRARTGEEKLQEQVREGCARYGERKKKGFASVAAVPQSGRQQQAGQGEEWKASGDACEPEDADKLRIPDGSEGIGGIAEDAQEEAVKTRRIAKEPAGERRKSGEEEEEKGEERERRVRRRSFRHTRVQEAGPSVQLRSNTRSELSTTRTRSSPGRSGTKPNRKVGSSESEISPSTSSTGSLSKVTSTFVT